MMKPLKKKIHDDNNSFDFNKEMEKLNKETKILNALVIFNFILNLLNVIYLMFK